MEFVLAYSSAVNISFTPSTRITPSRFRACSRIIFRQCEISGCDFDRIDGLNVVRAFSVHDVIIIITIGSAHSRQHNLDSSRVQLDTDGVVPVFLWRNLLASSECCL